MAPFSASDLNPVSAHVSASSLESLPFVDLLALASFAAHCSHTLGILSFLFTNVLIYSDAKNQFSEEEWALLSRKEAAGEEELSSSHLPSFLSYLSFHPALQPELCISQ